MSTLTILAVLALNFGISWWNAYVCGRAWVESKAVGGWIRVATAGGRPWTRLVVETGGAVLDQEHVDRLALPFQRLVADRTGSETGSGLGLSIVAAIAEAHGGHLELDARVDGGLRVTVSLPPADAPRGVPA